MITVEVKSSLGATFDLSLLDPRNVLTDCNGFDGNKLASP
jgi:hypothetical protein